MDTYENTNIFDWMYEGLEQLGFRYGILQTLGYRSTLEDFLKTTQGTITVRPALVVVAPLAAANYPFEIQVRYSAQNNGLHKPLFGKNIIYDETVQRMSLDEYEQLNQSRFSSRLEDLARDRKTKVCHLSSRDVTLDLEQAVNSSLNIL